jgi:hypothetical protein
MPANRTDDCGRCELLPTTTGWGRATQVRCPVHGSRPDALPADPTPPPVPADALPEEWITAAARAISRYDWDNALSANGEVSRHQRNEARVALEAAAPILLAAGRTSGPCCQSASDSDGHAHDSACPYLLGVAAGEERGWHRGFDHARKYPAPTTGDTTDAQD